MRFVRQPYLLQKFVLSKPQPAAHAQCLLPLRLHLGSHNCCSIQQASSARAARALRAALAAAVTALAAACGPHRPGRAAVPLLLLLLQGGVTCAWRAAAASCGHGRAPDNPPAVMRTASRPVAHTAAQITLNVAIACTRRCRVAAYAPNIKR
jgi:hypothetical protein